MEDTPWNQTLSWKLLQYNRMTPFQHSPNNLFEEFLVVWRNTIWPTENKMQCNSIYKKELISSLLLFLKAVRTITKTVVVLPYSLEIHRKVLQVTGKFSCYWWILPSNNWLKNDLKPRLCAYFLINLYSLELIVLFTSSMSVEALSFSSNFVALLSS